MLSEVRYRKKSGTAIYPHFLLYYELWIPLHVLWRASYASEDPFKGFSSLQSWRSISARFPLFACWLSPRNLRADSEAFFFNVTSYEWCMQYLATHLHTELCIVFPLIMATGIAILCVMATCQHNLHRYFLIHVLWLLWCVQFFYTDSWIPASFRIRRARYRRFVKSHYARVHLNECRKLSQFKALNTF